MTLKKLQAQFTQAVIQAYGMVYQAAPKDTWNLAVNALKMERTPTGVVIYIDQAIAPYMPYTNEPWTSARWNGKQNPNERWFDNVAELVAKNIAIILGGKKEEVKDDKT